MSDKNLDDDTAVEDETVVDDDLEIVDDDLDEDDARAEGGGAQRGSSIFDLFEPPPEVDPKKFGPIPIIGDESSTDDSALGGIDDLLPPEDEGSLTSKPTSGGVSLPKWTDPPTGQVPSTVDRDRGEGWSDVTGPTWKGEGPDTGEADDLADVFGDDAIASHGGAIEMIDDEEFADLPAAGSPQRPGVTGARPAQPATQIADVADDLGERNIPQAILVGVIFAGLALLAFRLGDLATIILIAAVAALAAVELFNSMRLAGLHPATLLGITASVALPLSVYSRDEPGFVLVIGLTVVFGAVWYIVGADTHRPALNLGLTMLGVMWIGGLAAFAGLLVLAEDGRSLVLAAIIVTVAFDTAAYAGGRAIGRTPFHPASPNKTWEGTLVGVIGAIAAGFVVYLLEISAFSDEWTGAVYLGLVAGVLAPIGDLTESMIKRDLDVKDMGTLLPGHGGILDRVDGLLFVLPGVYYLARVLDFI